VHGGIISGDGILDMGVVRVDWAIQDEGESGLGREYDWRVKMNRLPHPRARTNLDPVVIKRKHNVFEVHRQISDLSIIQIKLDQ